MKILITEEQYLSLFEQKSDFLVDKQSNAIMNATGLRSDSDYNKVNKMIDTSKNFGKQLDTHTVMTILEIGTAFIPFVGPFISAGIGLADAAIYYNEGDKKTAGLVGMFSIIPGIGGLAAKIGVGKISAKVLGNIGKKIGMGSKLTNGEVKIANRVAKHRKLLQAEIDKLAKSNKNVKLAKQNVKSKLKKQAIVKNLGANVGGYYGLGQAYNYGYDNLNQQNVNVDLNMINVNKISKVNSDAALNTKF